MCPVAVNFAKAVKLTKDVVVHGRRSDDDYLCDFYCTHRFYALSEVNFFVWINDVVENDWHLLKIGCLFFFFFFSYFINSAATVGFFSDLLYYFFWSLHKEEVILDSNCQSYCFAVNYWVSKDEILLVNWTSYLLINHISSEKARAF